MNETLNITFTFSSISQILSFICFLIICIALIYCRYDIITLFGKRIHFLKNYKCEFILIVLVASLPICIVLMFNIVNDINTDILGYYLTLIGIIVSVILVIEQLKYKFMVNSYNLLGKILDSIEKIYSYDENDIEDIITIKNNNFRLWVIKQMIIDEHVLFYSLQIRLAYIQYVKKNCIVPEIDKEIINMSQEEIGEWMDTIYYKNIKYNGNLTDIKKIDIKVFEKALLIYLNDLISSKYIISFLEFITKDTYDFYNKGYFYHLPSSNHKLKGYLNELNDCIKNKKGNKKEIGILKDIYGELYKIKEEKL
ncbi:MAG: hypothetical protein ACRCVG_00305 [Methanobacteriaceae archaeon]